MPEPFILIPGRTSRQGTSLNEGKYTDAYQAEVHTLRMNAEDMQRLEKLIIQAAGSDAGLQRKIAGEEDLQLLNLACGACNEADTLANVFGGNEEETCGSGNMRFVGLDVRAREIAEAAARFQSDSDNQFEFINGDATKLDRYQQLPGSFDVIFMRHQNHC